MSDSDFWEIGLLSVGELLTAAHSLKLQVEITESPIDFLNRRVENRLCYVLLFNGHFYIRMQDGKRNVLFDSGGLSHCVRCLQSFAAYTDLREEFDINVTQYQLVGSNLCGQFCLFVALLHKYRLDRPLLRTSSLLHHVDYYLSNVKANTFLMQYFTMHFEIGEEFDVTDSRFGAMERFKRFCVSHSDF